LRALTAQVLRAPSRQTLTAAFNVNTPLYVDDDVGATVARKRKEIAVSGVRVAQKAGFDRIAWDGASNELPSASLICQLGFGDLVELVHLAHENGLGSYVSAGMGPDDMSDATHSGVDAVGIGARMHLCDDGKIGEIDPAAIMEALRIRDEAAQDIFGRAANLLARMDTLAAGLVQSPKEERHRAQLYQAVRSRDEQALRWLLWT
jgi:hypothetical protein